MWVGASSLFAWSGLARAADVPGRTASQPPPPDAWRLRAGIGLGFATQSDQEELVGDEGYSGARFHVSAEFARMLSERVGVGVRGLYGWRSAGASLGGQNQTAITEAPAYTEQVAGAALEVPIVFGLDERRSATVALVPFGGPGWGAVGLYRSAPWHRGPLFGGAVELFVPRAHVGIAAGAYFLPLPPPGRTGGHDDLGSYFLSLIVGADVG